MTFGGATYGNSAYGDTGSGSNILQLEAGLVGDLTTDTDLSKNQFIAADLNGSLSVFADIEPVLNIQAGFSADFSNNVADISKNILLTSDLQADLSSTVDIQKVQLLDTGIQTDLNSVQVDLSRVKKLDADLNTDLQLDAEVSKVKRVSSDLQGSLESTDAKLLVLRNAPEVSPPFTVSVTRSYLTFVSLEQGFRTFVRDKT